MFSLFKMAPLSFFQQELEEDPEFQRIVSTQHGRNKRSSVPVTGMGRPPLAGRPLGTSGVSE